MRSRSSDLLIAAVVLPVWLMFLALHLETVITGEVVWSPFYASPATSAADYPEFRAYWPEVPAGDQVLHAGDLLRRVGDNDLLGAGRVELLARVLQAPRDDRSVLVVYERDGQRHEGLVHLLPHSHPWRTAPLAAGLGLAALFALVRGRGLRSARAFAGGAMAYSFLWLILLGGPPWRTYLGFGTMVVSMSLVLPLTLRAALLIPDDLPRPRPARTAWVWLLAPAGLFLSSWLIDFPLRGELGVRLLVACYALFIVALFAILAWNFRRADRRGRRQLKWVVFGFYVGLAPAAVTGVLTLLDPATRPVYEFSLVATIAIPVCVLIAIIRDDFLDIDRLITETIVYSLVAPVVLGVIFTVGPVAAERISEATGAQFLTSLWVLAILVSLPVPVVARLLRPQIVRFFARDQRRVETRLRELRSELDQADAPGPLLRTLGKSLAEIFDLESCAVFARTGSALAPVFAAGPLVPPGLAAEGSLPALVSASEGPVQSHDWRRWIRRGSLARADAALLETLGPEVLIAVRRATTLEGIICLGEKPFGDPFTGVELAHLENLAAKVGVSLTRYMEPGATGADQALHARLRDYVPDLLAQGISSGVDVDQGEIEVTVFFIDIRGYTPLAQSLTPTELFQVTSAYTAAASAVIRDHGGFVVQFQGDGLMAVFGAPNSLDGKEQAAVDAGREAYRAIRSGSFGGLPAGRLSVGVGIATGPAFVGNIQSAEQKVWSVLGNTTNFAARLEGLTRDFDAALVIDEVTHARVSDNARRFAPHPGTRVKGRDGSFTVYAETSDAMGS